MDLLNLTADMQKQGARRLLVISGDTHWSEQQAQKWKALLNGDWLCIGDMSHNGLCCKPAAYRTLLGREFRHAIFDARHAFHTEAFATLTGVLVAGSWLLLLVPPWTIWPSTVDNDALRWNNGADPIATPHFIAHLQRQILSDTRLVIMRQDFPLRILPLPARTDWQPDNISEQQHLLQQLLTAPPGVTVLTAPRGRGKSALAGMLARDWPGKCWITAPTRMSTAVLAKFAGDAGHFFAPDALLAHCTHPRPRQTDWLLIDEAAAIPTPLLMRLISYFPRVLLTTTVDGYEGTGHGFWLKFCASLPKAKFLTLHNPLRWAANDPLETLLNNSLLLEEPKENVVVGAFSFQRLEQTEWQTHPQSMMALYQLFVSAHYRTSPLDLRRMMDASGMHFWMAHCQQRCIAALWLVDEGSLSDELALTIWAGLRRPQGNLVAQSLVAHAGFLEAAQMRSQRVSRIAVLPSWRRKGMGRQLITASIADSVDLDFLSVSFGYTDELWQFWRTCGFYLVRIGTQREASSGCYSAIALLPLSTAGATLTQCAAKQLMRDYYWLQQCLKQSIAIVADPQQEFNEQDWQEVAGFAFAQRPFSAAWSALGRLLGYTSLALPALRGAIFHQLSVSELCQNLCLAGRKSLLSRWRQEARQALNDVNAQHMHQWYVRITSIKQHHRKKI